MKAGENDWWRRKQTGFTQLNGSSSWIPLCLKPGRATLSHFSYTRLTQSSYVSRSWGSINSKCCNEYVHWVPAWRQMMPTPDGFFSFAKRPQLSLEVLITQSSALWLKYTPTGLSHDKYKASKRKVNVSSLVFTLQDFNTFPGNRKAKRYYYTQKTLFFFSFLKRQVLMKLERWLNC